MGNTMVKKRKMGNASSAKWAAPDVHAKKDGLSPLGRSYSMPMHHAKSKSDNYHFVALTSSTLGTLKVDIPRDGEEGRTSMSKIGPEVSGSDNLHERLRKVVPEVMAPKRWAEADQIFSTLKSSNQGRVKGPEMQTPLREELTGEPETINMWELMEGLEEDARSSSPLYAPPPTLTPVAPKKVRSLEASLSFSSIHTITEVDVDFLEGAVKSGLKAAVESDSPVKGRCYSQSPFAGRTNSGNLPPRHGFGKENASSAPAVQREAAISTLTPVKLNSSVKGLSIVSGDFKGNSSIKSVGILPNTPNKVSGVVAAVVERIESRASVKSGVNDLGYVRTKSISSSTPNLLSSQSMPGGLNGEALARSPSSPLVLRRSRTENACTTPCNFTLSSEDCEGQLPSESPLFDPELLASFEKAIEDVSEDEWYRVRRSDAGGASTSGSSSDGDSPLRAANTSSTALESSPLARQTETELNPRKMSFSKVAPVDFRDVVLQKVVCKVDPFEEFEKRCPPGGEERVVVYVTSLRGIRKTFEDCSHMKLVIQGYRVAVDERDVSMHAEFRQELKDLLGKPMPVPRLFIKGRYIGGAEETALLHEVGTLGKLLETMPIQTSWEQCDGCGDHRFVPCSECSGSCKVITEDDQVVRCRECNENGLIRCPICF